jgi:hypothetical protein
MSSSVCYITKYFVTCTGHLVLGQCNQRDHHGQGMWLGQQTPAEFWWKNISLICEISGSHSGKYEDDRQLSGM